MCSQEENNPGLYDDSDAFMVTPNIDTIDIVENVITCIQNRAEPISNDLMFILGSVLKCIGRYDVFFTSEKNMKCIHCNSVLVSNMNFSDICNDITFNLKDHILKQDWYQDLKFLDSIIQCHKYFDIIIDAGNVLYKAGKMYPERLKYLLSVVEQTFSSTKKIALVFPPSFPRFNKEKTLKALAFIEQFQKNNFKLETITTDKMHDDLVICYLAARSDMLLQTKGEAVNIISNDNFVDHRLIASEDQHKFFNWLRHRQKNIDGYGNLLVSKMLPVIKDTNGSIHMISKEQTICCVKYR